MSLIKRGQTPEGITRFIDIMREMTPREYRRMRRRGNIMTVPSADEVDHLKQATEEDKRQAVEAGFEEGLKRGHAEASAACHIKLEEAKAALRADIAALIDAIEKERHELIRATRDEVVSLALDIARKILKDEAKWNRDVVLGIVEDAIKRIVEKEHVRIRVNLEDLPVLKANRSEILSAADGIAQLEIVDDRRVGLGGAILESKSGTVDARIETQLDEIERAFKEGE